MGSDNVRRDIRALAILVAASSLMGGCSWFHRHSEKQANEYRNSVQERPLEVPPDLTDEERDVYRDEVKHRVRVLAEKAIKIYERTVLVGKRVDTAASWVRESETALERLRAIYLQDDALSSLP